MNENKKEKISKPYVFTFIKTQLQSNGIYVQWSCENIGFGNMAFFFDKKTGFYIKTEAMGKEFANALVTELIKSIKKKKIVIELISESSASNLPFHQDALIVNLLETCIEQGKIVE